MQVIKSLKSISINSFPSDEELTKSLCSEDVTVTVVSNEGKHQLKVKLLEQLKGSNWVVHLICPINNTKYKGRFYKNPSTNGEKSFVTRIKFYIVGLLQMTEVNFFEKSKTRKEIKICVFLSH